VKLRQVLINLLNNAIKFTEKGGVAVRVNARSIGVLNSGGTGKESPNLQTPPLHHSTTPPLLSFEIEDSGPGIAADELDNLFEPFGQTESGRQAQEGTGLGLPISRKFIQLMGGDISVKSELGHGTTFRFEIQVGLAEQSTVDNQQSTIPRRVIALESGQRATGGSERYRILVVDDKTDNRKLLLKLLSSLNSPNSVFDLREATNGQEAIDIWQAWEPHLIWMDLRMPVMNGYEAIQSIRQHETQNTKYKTRSTKIIVLSASSFESDRTKALSKGCDDFLRKPFRDTEIFDLLHKHLGVRLVYEAGGPSREGGAGKEKQEGRQKMLTPEDLALLPDDVHAELQEAVETADLHRALRLVEQIGLQNEPLAKALTALLKEYQFDLLDTLLTKEDDSL
jgi:CheY-like chemotaxis protein